jgi:hypothetical protein
MLERGCPEVRQISLRPIVNVGKIRQSALRVRLGTIENFVVPRAASTKPTTKGPFNSFAHATRAMSLA